MLLQTNDNQSTWRQQFSVPFVAAAKQIHDLHDYVITGATKDDGIDIVQMRKNEIQNQYSAK